MADLSTIKRLLQEGEIEQALYLLENKNSDSIVLMQQLKSAERSYNLGMIEFNDYGMVRNRVTFAALQMIEDLAEKAQPTPVAEPMSDTISSPISPTDDSIGQPERLSDVQSSAFVASPKEASVLKSWTPKSKNIVLVVYAQADKSELMRFSNPFFGLRNHGRVGEWMDLSLETAPDEDLNRRLNKADVVLFFISQNFLDTLSFWNESMATLMARHQQGLVWVQPIYLKKCDWSAAPFAQISTLPNAKTPLWAYGNVDGAIKTLALQLKEIVEQ